MLRFKNEKTRLDVQKYVDNFLQADPLVIEKQWLGCLYKDKILSGFCIDHTIEWIDETIGYGVFATAPIKPGTYIGEYGGEVKRYRFLRFRRNDYIGEYSIGGKYPLRFIIDASIEGNFTRFLNHSDNPNIKSLVVILSGLLHVVFIAIKEIKAFEELTFDYGPNYWKNRKY